jgi:hypothetical protein
MIQRPNYGGLCGNGTFKFLLGRVFSGLSARAQAVTNTQGSGLCGLKVNSEKERKIHADQVMCRRC